MRQGKRYGESALTDGQLEGTYDGKNWEELKTIYNGKDPQFFAPPPFYTGTWCVRGEIPAFRFFEFSRQVEIPLVNIEYIYLELSCTPNSYKGFNF